MSDDLQTFARIAIATRASRYTGVSVKARSVTAIDGISSGEIQHRLRRYHAQDWSWERIKAVIAALVEAGALVLSKASRGGYKVASWDIMATLAQAVAA